MIRASHSRAPTLSMTRLLGFRQHVAEIEALELMP